VKELFDEMIKNEIKPFLKNYGYKKIKLYFYKNINDIIFIISFHLNNRNYAGHTWFDIHGEVYSKEIDRIMGNQELEEPKYDEPHFPTKFFKNVGYHIVEDTNISDLISEIKKSIVEEEQFFENIKTTDDVFELMIKNPLYKYQEILSYLIFRKDNEGIRNYINELYKRIGKKDNWKYYEINMNRILMKNNINKTIKEII
jgi:hypothetical protein